MNEDWLRWKARVGSLKTWGLLVLLFGFLLAMSMVGDINRTLRHPQGYEAVSIEQLIGGDFEADRFVTVSGIADYSLSYEETENGKLTALYYPLFDEEQGGLIFVRTTHTELLEVEDSAVTVSGMTNSTPRDLRDLIQSEIPAIESAGLSTTDSIYIEEGRKPVSLSWYILGAVALGFILLVCVALLFFPDTVFTPYPLQQIPPGADVKSGLRASGYFQKLKKRLPDLEVQKRWMKFKGMEAGLIPLQDNWIGFHIHVLQKNQLGLLTEAHWVLMLNSKQVISVEPGKVYGWRDRWGFSIRYKDEKAKEQRVIISFENPAAQASYANLLREKGFPLSSGMYGELTPLRSPS